MPAPLLPQGTLDFTELTRDEMLIRLQTLFNQVNPEWDDFSAAFPENLLLEGMAFIANIMRGTMEERVRQLNWATISDRLASIRLGRLGAFTLPGATSATLVGTFSLPGVLTATKDVPIPEGTRVIAGGSALPKKYRTTQAVTLSAGANNVQVNLEQAELIAEAFDSSLEPNLELILEQTPYIDGSAVVSASDGNYAAFTSFLGVASTTRAFVPLVDDAGRARLRFGTGINGAIPQGIINVTYKVGGGVAGEVESNATWTIQDSIEDVDSTAVTLLFTNAEPSDVANDAMTVDEARVRGPLSIRTINRMVIEEDFEFVAKSVPGIAQAFMATSETATVVGEDNGRLELVAYGEQTASGRFKAATPSDAKVEQVRAEMTGDGDFPPVMGFTFDVVAAVLQPINVSVRIFKTSNATADDVATQIQDALEDFFAVALDDRTPNPEMDFGARLLGSDGLSDFLIPWGSVFNAVQDVAGVRYISSAANNLLLNTVQTSVLLQPRQFPTLGTVTIFDEDQGGLQI